jgi:hypothetical protein
MIKKQIKQAMSVFNDVFGNKISWPKTESDDITVNMDGGVGGSWRVECAIDDEVVDCESLEAPIHGYSPYIGVPAPKVLEDDPWFGPAPISDANRDYMEQETLIKQEEYQETHSVESEDIHQVMYEIATSNWNTVDETKQSMGGSENIQNWNSGNGMGQYR